MHEAEFHEHVGEDNICRSVAEALDRARDLVPRSRKESSGRDHLGEKKYRCFAGDNGGDSVIGS